jgi:cell wall-associated NlpC family hydrolase
LRNSPAAVFALAGTTAAFVGDAGLSDIDLAELEAIEGTLDFGAPVEKQTTAKVTAEAANFRAGPGIKYNKIGKLFNGTVVTLIESNTDWAKVRTPAGHIGWVTHEVLAVDTGAVTNAAPAKATASKPAAANATTNNTAVNLRKGPGTNYASVGKLTKGVALALLSQEGSWYKVQTPRGTVGWVSAGLLTLSTGSAAAPAAVVAGEPAGTVSQNRTNLRQGPATAFASLGRMDRGGRLVLLARHGDWFKVRTARGTVGWVSGDLINASTATVNRVPVTNDVPAAPRQQAAGTAGAQATNERVAIGNSRGATAARVALRYVGARYVWGGASPRGFDCSGLVQYAYKQAGLSLPHKASAQFSTRYGTRVNSINALIPGDIVFFANTAGRGITHVALYVGNGRIVSANTPRTGVQLQSIHTRYWRSHYAGAIRPRG